jgi:2-amino-4-hydroxy-6-hydroxymethyldihydropteridine diphosphokinase
MADVYLGLGSNLGDRLLNLRSALDRMGPWGAEVRRVSSLYETEPVGFLEQDWFLNAAAQVKTDLAPLDLLRVIRGIEDELGRQRIVVNGPRTVDLDILLWEDRIIHSGGLTVPHPRMHERLFVLAPLRELAPKLLHPALGRTVEELEETLPATSQVRLWRKEWWLPGSASPARRESPHRG